VLAGEAGRGVPKLIFWLALAFVIVLVWRDPQGGANQIGGFLGDCAHLLTVALQKTAEFLGGLGNG
jgi:hypothetical protein